MSLTTYTPTKVEIPCSGDIIPAINRITAVHLSHGEYGGRIFSFRPYQWGEPFAVPVEWNVTMRVGDSLIVNALGVSSDRKTVYFPIDISMTEKLGKHYANVTFSREVVHETYTQTQIKASTHFLIFVDSEGKEWGGDINGIYTRRDRT